MISGNLSTDGQSQGFLTVSIFRISARLNRVERRKTNLLGASEGIRALNLSLP